MRLLPIICLALAGSLAACQTATRQSGDPSAAYVMSTRLADLIGRCWFAAGDPAFADYIYSPERNADQSRILIVEKNDPTGLPLLVVEPKSATVVEVYGPLADAPDGPRLRADVDRWTRGGEGCAA